MGGVGVLVAEGRQLSFLFLPKYGGEGTYPLRSHECKEHSDPMLNRHRHCSSWGQLSLHNSRPQPEKQQQELIDTMESVSVCAEAEEQLQRLQRQLAYERRQRQSIERQLQQQQQMLVVSKASSDCSAATANSFHSNAPPTAAAATPAVAQKVVVPPLPLLSIGLGANNCK